MSATTILIVEDEAIVAADLTGKLGRLGYQVAGSAAGGEEAVTLAHRLRPDLVLMDIWLEGPIDGIEAAEAIRQQYDVPVIYLTAHSDPATLARAKLTGPFGYILKPFEERELATQIEMAIYRHQADQQLRQQREWLRVTLTSIGDAVIAADAQSRITFTNPMAESLTGWKAEEALGQPVQSVFHIVNEQTREPLEEPVARVLREGRAVELANHAALVTKDGHMVPVEDSAAPILDAANQVIGVVLVFHDVTEKRKAEEALRKSEQEFRALAEAVPQIVWATRPDGWNIYFNQQWTDYTGLTLDESYGHGWNIPFHPDDKQRAWDAWQRATQHNETYLLECRLRRADGVYRWWLIHGAPICDANGKIQKWIGTCTDIEEIKRAEQQLFEMHQRLQALMEAVPVGVSFSDDPTCQHISGNPAVQAQFEVTPQDNLSASASDTAAPGRQVQFFLDGRRVTDAELPLQRAVTENRVIPPMELEVQLPSGRRWFADASGAPVRDAQGKVVGGIAVTVDVTERKRAEESLRESEQQFRALADSIPNLAWWANGDGYITWYNRRWYEYTGTTPEQMEGWGWQSVHDPEELPRVLERWQASLATGKSFDMEFPLRGRDGQFRWFLTRVLPLRDGGGRVVRWFGTNTDVNEVRQARQAAEAANAAKGQFLANMSHELRTPMNAILGMIDVALPKAADPIVQDCLQTAKGSADLLLTLLNDLLDSAKIESGKLELESAPFSLRRMLDQITRVLSVRASEKGLCFYCRMPEGTPDAVVGDRMRLQQVLLNLAGNAIKFTERGDVEIGLHAQSRDGEVAIKFDVRDTGIGIPPSGQERLFQPFAQADASMSRRFGGTGLGLSICKNLVEMMGGRIWVESELGKGSTFYFTVLLPLAKELPAENEAPLAIAAAIRSPLRILLVEDNPANQKLATYLLQDRGHTVEIAGDGQEAVYLTEQNAYDVILMDVQMPGMNGMEATAAIRKREDGKIRVPIIAMTAHAMKGDRDRCLEVGMDGYLSKPIKAFEMIGLIESLSQHSAPPAEAATATLSPKETSSGAMAVVFNSEEAIALCFNSEDLLREMILCFFDEVDNLFPHMHAALEKGDLVEVGRLGHRLKGTIVYLGAESAKQAALRVERFCKATGGIPSEAEKAINSLEHECIVLKTALTEHPLSAELKQSD